MEPISRKMIAKKVAGFHCPDSHDFLGGAMSGTVLFSRRKGLGIMLFQKEVSAMRGTVEMERLAGFA